MFNLFFFSTFIIVTFVFCCCSFSLIISCGLCDRLGSNQSLCHSRRGVFVVTPFKTGAPPQCEWTCYKLQYVYENMCYRQVQVDISATASVRVQLWYKNTASYISCGRRRESHVRPHLFAISSVQIYFSYFFRYEINANNLQNKKK